MEGEDKSGGMESARKEEDKDAMLYMNMIIKEQVNRLLKGKEEELKMKSGYLERKEEDIRRIVDDLERKKSEVDEMMKRMEEHSRLEIKGKGRDIGDTRKRDSKAEKERRGQEDISETVDQKMKDEIIQNEVMGTMQNVEDELEEERASMEKEKEGLERDEELWRQTVRKAIADGMRKEGLIVEEEVRRSVEEELNGKWRKRVEEVDSWWKTQNSALKGEWENERVEWEREKARNVKEMEEISLKMVEAERMRVHLEEKNKRLTSEAEYPGEEWNSETEKNKRDWMEEKYNKTKKLEDKLKKDVDEAKKANRMQMGETMNILLQNYEREIKTLKEDVEMKEKGLYELQRKVDDSEKFQMYDLSNQEEQLYESKYDPLAGNKYSTGGQSEEVKNANQEHEMDVRCEAQSGDVVKKEVKVVNRLVEVLRRRAWGIPTNQPQ